MKQDLMHKDVNDVNITPEERRSNLAALAAESEGLGLVHPGKSRLAGPGHPDRREAPRHRPLREAGIACAAWPTRRSAGSFRSPKTAWPSCCCSPGAVCPGWARACGSGLPCAASTTSAAAAASGACWSGCTCTRPSSWAPASRRGGDRAAVGIHHRHHRPL